MSEPEVAIPLDEFVPDSALSEDARIALQRLNPPGHHHEHGPEPQSIEPKDQ